MVEKMINLPRTVTIAYVDPRDGMVVQETMAVPQKYECIFDGKFQYLFPEEHAIMVRRMKRTFENYIQRHCTFRKTNIIKMGIMGF